MKICSKCKIEKELNHSNFCLKKASKDGYGNMCKICVKDYNDNYDYKIYNINNKEKIKNRQAKRYENKKDELLLKGKNYFNNHKEEQRARGKKWHIENREHHISKTVESIKIRLKNDPIFKLKETLRNRIYNIIVKNRISKSKRTMELLGCTPLQFKQHLESQFKPEMNWNNHGQVWEIDHIISCSNFDLTDFKQQEICFHYTNMQPLFKTTAIAESFGYSNEVGNRNKYNKNAL